MREIQLSRGKVAMVDDEDYDALNAFKWHTSSAGYAGRQQPDESVKRKRKRYFLPMHRHLMSLKYGDPRQVDHINGNRLDNRRENLRICTAAENRCNRGAQSNNTSGYKGVRFDPRIRRFMAYIRKNGKYKYLGSYATPEEAHMAYTAAAIKIHGEFANPGE